MPCISNCVSITCLCIYVDTLVTICICIHVHTCKLENKYTERYVYACICKHVYIHKHTSTHIQVKIQCIFLLSPIHLYTTIYSLIHKGTGSTCLPQWSTGCQAAGSTTLSCRVHRNNAHTAWFLRERPGSGLGFCSAGLWLRWLAQKFPCEMSRSTDVYSTFTAVIVFWAMCVFHGRRETSGTFCDLERPCSLIRSIYLCWFWLNQSGLGQKLFFWSKHCKLQPARRAQKTQNDRTFPQTAANWKKP